MKNNSTSSGSQLPWTGERIVPGVNGDSKLEHLHRYAVAADLAAGKDVLDIACGEGYGSKLLSSTARSVLGVDNSAEAIEHARSRYKADNLSFVTGLCQEIPLAEASVDLVVSFETIQHILEQEEFIAEVRRVLRPGGRFFLSCPNKAAQQHSSDAEKIFFLRELHFQELHALVEGAFKHHFWLAQRVSYGSLTYGFNGSASPQLHSYDGDFHQIRSRKDFTPPPSFMVLCSDQPFGPLPNSVFENPNALGRLQNHAAAVEAPLTGRIKELELRISRMECSTWWRLRKPIKFITDIVLGRPATGMFTRPKALPASKGKGKILASHNASILAKSGSGLKSHPVINHTALAAQGDATVIVPAYNNLEELQFCLAALLRYTSVKHRIMVIDDCSTDVHVWPMLQRLATQFSQIELHRNSVNRGYTAVVNQGLQLCGGDVAIVNSNVRVSKKWLHKLIQCAAKSQEIATVSPLVNQPGPFDIPFRAAEGGLPPSFGVTDLAESVERMHSKLHPRVPAASPACFYLRREAIDQVGVFDEKNFPQGYGGEADFSSRASAAGFIHLIEDSTFVFQKRAPNLKERYQQLSAQGREALARLHPALQGQIADWQRNDPLDKLRLAVREDITFRADRLQKLYRKEARRKSKNAILYVVQEGNGGTVLTSEDLVKSISSTHPCYLLRTSFQQWSFYLCEDNHFHLLQRFQFETPWVIDSGLDEERLRALEELLTSFHFSIAHVRHLLGNAPEIIIRIRQRGVPVVFSFHDFHTVCPNIQLFDNQRKFCAGHCGTPPAAGAPVSFTNGNGSNGTHGGSNGSNGTNGSQSACADCSVPTIWPLVTLAQPLKHHYVHVWRKRAHTALEYCDGFVTTSKFSTEILMQHFDFLRKKDVRIIGHGRDLTKFRLVGTPPSGNKVRIVYFGSLQTYKGAELLVEIMRLDRGGKKRFEFHFLGSISRNGADPRRLGAIYHGRYKRDQLADLVEAIKPSFAIIPSIWPETFCHTLTEAWAMGLPVFASNMGALRERIQTDGGGWLLDPESPRQWYDKMLAVSSDPAEYERQLQKLRQRPLKTVRQMAEEYLDLYERVLENHKSASSRNA